MSKYIAGLLAVVLALSGCGSSPKAAEAAQPVKLRIGAADVKFTGVGGLELQGTLLIPEGAGKHPALLLLPGSGPTDRDGNTSGIKIELLKDLAESLAKNGIATLRFDKRAVASVYMAKFPKDKQALDDFFSWDAFVGDAKDAFEFLKKQPEIDASRVGVLGHSEGGAIALAMAKDVHPTALILASTAGRDLGTVIEEQIRTGYSSKLVGEAATAKYADEARHVIAEIKSTHRVPGDVPAELSSLFPGYLSKYLYSLITFDPTEAAKAYPGPVLIVQGEKDIQVSPERDAPALLKALPAKKELFKVPNATHCLKEFKGETDPGFAGPVVPAALDKIDSWAKSNL